MCAPESCGGTICATRTPAASKPRKAGAHREAPAKKPRGETTNQAEAKGEGRDKQSDRLWPRQRRVARAHQDRMVTDNLALGRLKTALRSNRVGPGALGNHGVLDLLAWGAFWRRWAFSRSGRGLA